APATPQTTFMAQKKHSAAHRLAMLACLAAWTCSFGQTQPSAKPPSPVTKTQAAGPPATPAPAPAAAPSLLDHPPRPATVNLVSGRLTIQADNSSLSAILHQVSAAGGMKVEGLRTGGSPGERVFGSYGPGAPRDVLSDLLNGSGYNVIMLGETPSGAPRELTLTAQTAGGATTKSARAPSAVQNEDDPEQIQEQNQDQDDTQPTEYPPAVEYPPAQPPGAQNGIRTPQQMLEELQRMHQQQQQDQQQQPDQQQPN
ncbi:MAG: hypothetical protein WBP63_12205, partial [Silvibacterium sp.]